MAHFYGTVRGARGEASRCGGKASLLTTTAASWNGAIKTTLFVDTSGRDCYLVEQIPWHGAGTSRILATGVVGSTEKTLEK